MVAETAPGEQVFNVPQILLAPTTLTRDLACRLLVVLARPSVDVDALEEVLVSDPVTAA